MNEFAWALAAFVLIHVGISATGLRAVLVRTIGEGPYRTAVVLASLALIAWLVRGFGAMRADPFDPLNEALWAPPDWLRWPAYVLIALGLISIVVGVFTPGPTLAGYEKKGLAAAEPAHGILRITRHPFLWGVALWSAGHLLVNGERFAVMLFGALGLMVLFGTRSIDRKGRARDPDGWGRFEQVSSNVPFAAIAQGRNNLRFGEMGWRVLAGLAVVALLAWAHPMLFGTPVA
ncbi:MAG TPA: NnrU family protein [Vitreimonas sp.]|nr:NnrU family protein [Vitreimonas sp.]